MPDTSFGVHDHWCRLSTELVTTQTPPVGGVQAPELVSAHIPTLTATTRWLQAGLADAEGESCLDAVLGAGQSCLDAVPRLWGCHGYTLPWPLSVHPSNGSWLSCLAAGCAGIALSYMRD